MRTTYKSKNPSSSSIPSNLSSNNESKTVLVSDANLKEQYKFLYMQTLEEAELKASINNRINMASQGSNLNSNAMPIQNMSGSSNLGNRITTPYVQPVKKKSKFVPILIIILSILAVVGGLLFYFLVIKKNQEEEKLNLVQQSIDALYSDDTKVDTREGLTAEDILKVHDSIDSKDDRYSEMLSELVTIEAYLSSKDMLAVYESAEYDLETKNLEENLIFLKEGTSVYSVEGLATTMNTRVDALLAEYNLYFTLKEELSSITDYLNYNSGYYSEQIELIKHTKNKEALMLLHQDLETKQVEALVEQNTPEPEVVATPTDATPMDATPTDVPTNTDTVG